MVKSLQISTLLVCSKVCKFQNSSCMAKSLQISKLFLYGQKSANFKTCLVCSTHKGVKQCSRYVTQVQQQRPESPMVTLTKPVGKHKVHKLYLRHFLFFSFLYVNLFSKPNLQDQSICYQNHKTKCTCAKEDPNT